MPAPMLPGLILPVTGFSDIAGRADLSALADPCLFANRPGLPDLLCRRATFFPISPGRTMLRAKSRSWIGKFPWKWSRSKNDTKPPPKKNGLNPMKVEKKIGNGTRYGTKIGARTGMGCA